jgi:hypothetical protein
LQLLWELIYPAVVSKVFCAISVAKQLQFVLTGAFLSLWWHLDVGDGDRIRKHLQQRFVVTVMQAAAAAAAA